MDLAYDDDGRLSTVTSGSKTWTYTYDPAGNPTKVTFPNGTEQTRVYDRAGRVTEVTHQKESSIFAGCSDGPTRLDRGDPSLDHDF